MNFGIVSKINNKLITNNIIVGNLAYSTSTIDNYFIIKLEANTNNRKEFIDILLNYFKQKNFNFDEELFNLYKKGYIIDLIVRNDNFCLSSCQIISLPLQLEFCRIHPLFNCFLFLL